MNTIKSQSKVSNANNPEKKDKIIKTIAQLMDTYKGKPENSKMGDLFSANLKSTESLKDKLIKNGVINREKETPK